MALSIPSALASDIAALYLARMDAGSGPATLKAFTGSKPASPETAPSGTLLASWTLTDPSGVVSGNVLTLDFDPDLVATVQSSGTAGWWRIADSAGVAVVDGSAGTSGEDMTVSGAWVSGGTVTLTTGTITIPLA